MQQLLLKKFATNQFAGLSIVKFTSPAVLTVHYCSSISMQAMKWRRFRYGLASEIIRRF